MKALYKNWFILDLDGVILDTEERIMELEERSKGDKKLFYDLWFRGVGKELLKENKKIINKIKEEQRRYETALKERIFLCVLTGTIFLDKNYFNFVNDILRKNFGGVYELYPKKERERYYPTALWKKNFVFNNFVKQGDLIYLVCSDKESEVDVLEDFVKTPIKREMWSYTTQSFPSTIVNVYVVKTDLTKMK